MQFLTLGLGNWLRYLGTKNPLVRGSDRLEAMTWLMLITVVLLAMPIAGAVGTATHDSLTRQYAADRASRQEIVATATGDSIVSPDPYAEPFVTPIRWTYAGKERTAEMRSSRMSAGDTVTIWVDASGGLTTRPPTERNAATAAVLAGFGLWFTIVGIAATVGTMVHLRLDRSRQAAWDRELDDLAGNGGRTNHGA